MSDFLAIAYPWIKALHIMAVISWMAALFYLPRLFVHHTEKAGLSGDTHEIFTTMEFKLATVIMRPAMIATWVFGLGLVFTPGIVDWTAIWPYTKAVSVIAMTGFHEWLMARMRDFAQGINRLSGRQFRLMNEVPTFLMIIIVLSVVVKF